MTPHHHHGQIVRTAVEARDRLAELEAERVLAMCARPGPARPFVARLDQEIEAWRTAYIGAAVTEIATLRAELSGPQIG